MVFRRSIYVVKNIGQGKAYDAFAALKNLSEEKLNVKKGRTKLGPIAPGETRTATFILEPKKGLEDAPVSVRLELGDKETWEIEKEKLLLPVGAPLASSPSPGVVRVQVDTNVLQAAIESSDKLASVKKGAVLARLDDALFQARLKKAEADLQSAEAHVQLSTAKLA